MDWPRVKSIMIAFLLLVNAVIGSVFAWRYYEDAAIERQAIDDAVAAFERLGVAVDRALLTGSRDDAYVLELERDYGREQRAVTALIGEALVESRGGSTLAYSGTRGVATFYGGTGAFEIGISDPPATASDPESVAALLADAEFPGALLAEGGTAYGAVAEVMQTVDGYPVFDCTYALHFDESGLFQVRGSILFGEAVAVEAAASKPLATVLLGFAGEMRSRGTPCREIASAELGYITAPAAPGITRLTPVWRVVADGKQYDIDALTGAAQAQNPALPPAAE